MTAEPARQTKGARRRESALAAAADLFAAKGYDQTSLQDVADRVGVLKGSLYYYFASKEEMLFHVLLRNHEQLFAYVTADTDYAALEPLGAVQEFIEKHVEYVLSTPGLTALYSLENAGLQQVDEWRRAIGAVRARHEAALRALVERAVAEPHAEDAVLTTRALLSMATAAYRWYRPSSRYSIAEVAQHHGRLAAASLRRQPGSDLAEGLN